METKQDCIKEYEERIARNALTRCDDHFYALPDAVAMRFFLDEEE